MHNSIYFTVIKFIRHLGFQSMEQLVFGCTDTIQSQNGFYKNLKTLKYMITKSNGKDFFTICKLLTECGHMGSSVQK